MAQPKRFQMNVLKKRESKFTQVSNSFLRDNELSFKAKGLFCYMFSMDDNWNFTLKSIATQQGDGLASITSAMKELKDRGYVIYTKHTSGKGTYFLDDEPKLENPDLGNATVGKPDRIKNTNLNKNTNTQTEEEKASIDYDLYFIAWNKLASQTEVKKIAKLSNARKNKIKVRAEESKDFKKVFIECLRKINSSNFLRGFNNNKWIASFDWLVENDTNYLKILEGKYDDK